MIQDVRTRWNNTFLTLKRVFILKNILKKWLIHTIILKLQCLRLTTKEWDQVKIIIELLRSFQQITKSLNSSSKSSMHTTWIVYNIMYSHLKNYFKQIKIERFKYLQILRSAIFVAQNKLNKYYEVIFDKADLYFNLVLCLNSCDKLNYYKISRTARFVIWSRL